MLQKSEFALRRVSPKLLVYLFGVFLIFFFDFLSFPVKADEQEEIVIFQSAQSDNDHRNTHSRRLLKAALEITKEKYGPYRLEFFPFPLSRTRTIRTVVEGEQMNMFSGPPSSLIGENVITIPIPIKMGLVNYRVLLVNKKDAEIFRNITLEDLKKIPTGLHKDWSITEIMEDQGFEIIKGNGYDALFSMLEHGRFKYMSRRVTEVFPELDMLNKNAPGFIIEPTIMLHLPLPDYFHISPKFPRLATRVEEGLNMMIENGAMEEIFLESYGEIIDQIGFEKRTILNIENPSLEDLSPLDRKELWFKPTAK